MKWIVKSKRHSKSLFDDFIRSRNIENLEEFMSSDISNFKDPYIIPMMDLAVERILKAINAHESIFVYGDFDVDGTAATAILWIYLKSLGGVVMPFIPNRVDEGYGMNLKTLTKLKSEGASLIISVDCGIRDIELTKQAKLIGLDLIISDHHEFVEENGEIKLPDTIVIHSKYPGSPYKCVLSGGATAWKITCALEKKITGNPLTDKSLSLLELATLTTITDIMPLIDENRIIVKKGIEYLRTTKNIGLLKLYEISNIDKSQIDVYHMGFILGPRLNAPGRVDNSAMDSLRLLCTQNASQAGTLAIKLNDLNKIRQEWTSKYLEMACEKIDLSKKIIFVLGEDWPEGIVGLVAGKMAEKFGRPCLVATHNLKEDKITGSARSYGSVNIVEIISFASKFLVKFGGHRAAAGFSLNPTQLDEFKTSLYKSANMYVSDELLEHKLDIDLEAAPSEISLDFIKQIESLSPFGNANPIPIFSMLNLQVIDIKKLGKNNEHLKLKISDMQKEFIFEAIGFNYDKEPVELGSQINIAFTPKINQWNGNVSVQLEIKDINKST